MAEDLVERVHQIIPRYSMLNPGSRVGVAVSGGADSLVLLHVLHRLVSALAIHLTVLHVNHGLRGAESDADEQFVRDLAGILGHPFFATRGVPGPGNLEQEARRIRIDFFRECREKHGLDRIALGHTRSDQAETVLYRLLRGSGIAGLAGMRAVTEDNFVRPLLHISRNEVRAWAVEQGIVWREDASNSDERFARNLLRMKVIPALANQFNPNLESVLAGTAEVAAAEDDYWQSQIETLYRKSFKTCDFGLTVEVSAITNQHRAVQRRILRHAIGQIRGDLRSIDLQHVEATLALCDSQQGHDRIVIPGVDALRSFGVLLLTKPGRLSAEARDYSVDLSWNTRLELPFRAGSIELSGLNSDSENCVKFKKESQFPVEFAYLHLDALVNKGSATRLQVRNWRPGDETLRPGHQNREKIKSLFQEFRVLLWKRRHWPVATVNDEIFWSRGFGASSAYLASAENKRVATLCYWPGEEVGSFESPARGAFEWPGSGSV